MKLKHLIFLLAAMILGLSSCKIGRFVFYNFADIKDHKKFHNRSIQKDEASFTFPYSTEEKGPKQITLNQGQDSMSFEDFLVKNKTVAFLIIHNDTIQYEKYFKGYSEESIVPSFSMAKSVTSILIGIAIEEGIIQSVDEPITKYIPELSDNGFDQVTIKHLLQMTSGLDFNESYTNPLGHAASFYYGTNLRKEISKLKLKQSPGTSMEYVSGNTQLLGLVLDRALKNQSISEYLEEKIWKPLQMEYDASWSIDRKKDGLEKTFCCLNARARDFAKIGRLYLNKGKWNDKQIVPQSWVETSTMVDTTEGSASYYQYQWWLPTDEGDFSAEGILGQFIYVNPNNQTIIVRLGKDWGKYVNDWPLFFNAISKKY